MTLIVYKPNILHVLWGWWISFFNNVKRYKVISTINLWLRTGLGILIANVQKFHWQWFLSTPRNYSAFFDDRVAYKSYDIYPNSLNDFVKEYLSTLRRTFEKVDTDNPVIKWCKKDFFRKPHFDDWRLNRCFNFNYKIIKIM